MMALAHTILTCIYNNVLATGRVLKIQQGVHSIINCTDTITNAYTSRNNGRMPVVWNGNVFMPLGSNPSGSNGWWKYNHDLGMMEMAFYFPTAYTMIPLFDRVGFTSSGDQGWGYSPERRVKQTSATTSIQCTDYATYGTSIMIKNRGLGKFHTWEYPFTASLSVGYTCPDITSCRVCELGGKFYTVWIDDAAGELKLYELTSMAYSLIAGASSYVNLTAYDQITPNGQAFFKFNQKLFLIVATNSGAQPLYRVFEFDPLSGSGSSVERTAAWLPASWKVNSVGNYTGIMEVKDDLSPTEQVFLIAFQGGQPIWECYEFVEGLFTLVDTGIESLTGGGGVIFDPTAKGAQFKTAVDSIPSSYIQTEVEVFDGANNGTVDIDPRYRLDDAEPEPYTQCTGKAPNNVVTGLASSPAAGWGLSDLDDDFADGIIDEELWEEVCFAVEDDQRDYGAGVSGLLNVPTQHETNGAIRLGKDAETSETDQGCGIRSKARVSGAFQIDFTIANPENIKVQSVPYNQLYVLVRTAVGRGFGFCIWKFTGDIPKVRGIYMLPNNDFVVTASINCLDGDVLRFVRDGADAWTLTHDPAGAANDLTPVGGAPYPEEVEVMIGAKSNTAAIWVETATADADCPGISDIAFSGAGSVGRYQGGVKHRFDWDHISDLGAGVIGTAQLFIDTQRT